jgi:predicted alpha/beta hydrolase family esterase
MNKNKINVVIVHGCPSTDERGSNPKTRTYDKHWLPWLKKELQTRGIKTEIPLMPTPWQPDYQKFKKKFSSCRVTKDTILIGHSCGSAFLVRWLGETGQKISRLILVAPWKIPPKLDKARREFYLYQINKSIKSRVGKIVYFTADNEDILGKMSLRIFYKALGGKIIELKGKGHYTFKYMGTEEFPELLKEII